MMTMIANLGPLEKKILEILWRIEKGTARDVCTELEKAGKRKAYSTVRTILNRLMEKDVIVQKKDRKEGIYIYSPVASKKEFERRIVEKTFNDLLSNFGASTISYLTENLSESEEDVKKIKEKLRGMRKDD